VQLLEGRSNQHNKCGLQDICTKVRLWPRLASLASAVSPGMTNCNQDPVLTSMTIPVCSRSSRWPYVCIWLLQKAVGLPSGRKLCSISLGQGLDIDHCHCVSRTGRKDTQKSEEGTWTLPSIPCIPERPYRTGCPSMSSSKEYGFNISTTRCISLQRCPSHPCPSRTSDLIPQDPLFRHVLPARPKSISKKTLWISSNGRMENWTDFNEQDGKEDPILMGM